MEWVGRHAGEPKARAVRTLVQSREGLFQCWKESEECAEARAAIVNQPREDHVARTPEGMGPSPRARGRVSGPPGWAPNYFKNMFSMFCSGGFFYKTPVTDMGLL